MFSEFRKKMVAFGAGISGLGNGVAGFKAEVKGFYEDLARAEKQLLQLEREETILTQHSRSLVLVDEFVTCFLATDEELGNVDGVSEVKWYFNHRFDDIVAAINGGDLLGGHDDMWCMPIKYFTDESNVAIADIVRRIEGDLLEEDSLLAAPVGDLMALAFEGNDYEEIVERSLGYDDADDLIAVLKKVSSLSDYYQYVVEAGGPKGAGENTNGVVSAYVDEPSVG